ncbi:hypothetical protein [Luteimonas deserti]|uniref:Uncharacterized protein n=1 Tax=Luteimonas deserti TaxID=2752306 RepID=A0A7Z0QRU5_9GAMM|nr:hypothetical protein [Luteimonas deserti]NYZ63701.1 hypothetical protein [Luteimonas deserti]
MSRFQHARIAEAGLDLLHTTRLKVACSLLMAERVHADLGDWPDTRAHLLVAGLDDAGGLRAAGEAREAGVTVLAIARNADGATDALAHGVTVKELFERLRMLLVDGTPSQPDARAHARSEPPRSVQGPPTLFDQVAAAGGLVLVQRAGMRAAIDRGRGVVHVAGDGDADVFADTWTCDDWEVRALARTEVAGAIDGLLRTMPLESVAWQAAARAEIPVLASVSDDAIALRGWPAVDIEAIPAHWILPMACLLHGACNADALARMTGIPSGEAARIIAAAHLGGLAEIVAPTVRPRQGTPGGGPPPATGFLARVARRFGLQFGGHRG